MKSILALSTLGVAAVLSFTVACDNGGSAVSCTADADCANEAENTTCDPDVGVCVAPAEPVCESDTDCDLEDTGEGSPIVDAADCGEGDVQFTAFDGNDYCGTADEDGLCAEGGFDTATVESGGADVVICVTADGTCDEDGQCG